jgi:hypothetical protein
MIAFGRHSRSCTRPARHSCSAAPRRRNVRHSPGRAPQIEIPLERFLGQLVVGVGSLQHRQVDGSVHRVANTTPGRCGTCWFRPPAPTTSTR